MWNELILWNHSQVPISRGYSRYFFNFISICYVYLCDSNGYFSSFHLDHRNVNLLMTIYNYMLLNNHKFIRSSFYELGGIGRRLRKVDQFLYTYLLIETLSKKSHFSPHYYFRPDYFPVMTSFFELLIWRRLESFLNIELSVKIKRL